MTERAFDAVEELRRRMSQLAGVQLEEFLAGELTEEEPREVLAVLEKIAQSHQDRKAGRSHN